MHKALLAIVVVTAFCIAARAHASVAWQGTLSDVHFMATGVVLVYTSGSRADIPACAAGQPTRFALDATTAAGKTQAAGLMMAYAAGKPVIIVGTGSCAYNASESIDYFYVVGT